MKIQCPACKTSYHVNLPNIGPKGVAVECAKCHNKFVVKPEGRPLQEAPRPEKVAVGAPTLQEKAPASDFKSESPPAPQNLGAEETPEPSFDDFLDQLIEKESIKEPVAPPPPAKKVPESKPVKPQQTDNLDNLLDDLMSSDLSFETPETVSEATGGDETKTAPQETALEQDSGSGPTEMPETSHKEPEIDFSGIQGLDDVAMDNIWDQAVAEGAKEEESKEETPSPPAPARKGVPNQAAAPKQAKKEPSAPAQTAPPAETGEADLWAQAFAEQDGLNKNLQGEGAGEPAGAAAPAAPPAETGEADLWAQAFAEQDGLNKNIQGEGAGEPAGEAAPAAPSAETSEEDLWAQAFAEQDGLNKNIQGEGAGEPAGEAAPAAPPAETNEEDLWAQAFAEQDGLNKNIQGEGAAGEEAGETAETAVETAEEAGAETAEDLEEEELAEELEEAGVGAADYDLEEEGEEARAEAKKKKLLGFIPLPTTKTGKLVLGGSVAALLLTLGGGYFAYKTFMPQKAVQKADASKKPAKDQKPADQEKAKDQKAESEEKAAAGKPEETAKPEAAAKPEGAAKPEETAKAEGEQPKTGDIVKDLKDVSKGGVELQKPEGGEKTPDAAEVALSAEKTTVAMGTIMPVAFNPTDIRVLSFTLEVELSSEETASLVRNNLPVYEKITVQTVEEFLQRKFYNDILYVKEKLQKKLEVAYNKSIQGGRVKKTKFKEFLIQ